MEIRLEIDTGSDWTTIRFLQLTGYTRLNIVKEAVQAGAEIALEEARARAPRRTGRLRAGIVTRTEAFPTDHHVVAQINTRREAFGKDHYPAFIEFGWTRPDGTKQPPVPFLRGALYGNQDRIQSAMREVIRRRVAVELKHEFAFGGKISPESLTRGFLD